MDEAHIQRLSKMLIDGIQSKCRDIIQNGDPAHSYPGCVNLSFAYVEGIYVFTSVLSFGICYVIVFVLSTEMLYLTHPFFFSGSFLWNSYLYSF